MDDVKLKNCPNCNNVININDKKCPYCNWIEEIKTEETLNLKTNDINEQKKSKNDNMFLYVLLIIGVLGVICYFVIYPIFVEWVTEDFAYKPIIYLYPTEETIVEVKLLNEELITTTYPKYEDNWKILAKPNGDLIDLKTSRTLYGLYWEGVNKYSNNINEGFVIKGKDTIKFLEEKLHILGLTEREANEFIIYWLPKMEKNEYNLIRFQTLEEINKNMPLEITPKPDTIIRVMMEFKPLKRKIKIKEQNLSNLKINREGFVVVEWGGTELN